MKVTLKAISANSFKNHHTIDLKFGVLNIIKGQNGEGKTTIGEIVSWVLFGTDMMGSKLDPTPQQGAEFTSAYVELDIDGKFVIFGRRLKKGKADFTINDVPKKATEFDEIVKSMFDKDLFLSLFNPSYFPALHWTKQREMVLSYVTPPAMKEVLATLPKLQANALAEAFKKHNIDDLDAIHKKNKTQKEKDLIAAKSRVATLEESNTWTPHDLGELEAALEKVEQEVKEAAEIISKHSEARFPLITKELELKSLFATVERIKQDFMQAKQEDGCVVCGTPFSEEKKKTVLENINAEYKTAVSEYKKMKSELESISVPPTFDSDKFNELQDIRSGLQMSIRNEKSRLEAVAKIEEAKANVEAVLASLNESVFLLDAIKAYRAKEAELQAKKVQDVFPTLTIRLYNVTKDGTENPTFEIEKDGKPFSKLSLGEKARAGLEVVGMLKVCSNILVPCFIDNAESVTSDDIFNGHQVIAAYAVPNQTLTMEVDQ